MSTDNINGEIVDTTGEPTPGAEIKNGSEAYLKHVSNDGFVDAIANLDSEDLDDLRNLSAKLYDKTANRKWAEQQIMHVLKKLVFDPLNEWANDMAGSE